MKDHRPKKLRLKEASTKISPKHVKLKNQIVDTFSVITTLAGILRPGGVKCVLGCEALEEGTFYSCYVQDEAHTEPSLAYGETLDRAIYEALEELYGRVTEETNET